MRTLQRKRARVGDLDVRQQIAVRALGAGVAKQIDLADDAVQREPDLVRERLDEASLRGRRFEQPMRRARVEQDLADQSHVRRLSGTEEAISVPARDDEHQLRVALEVDQRLRDDALPGKRVRQG